MRIAEIFQSIQGEGFLVGTPSVFVRTTGCNLRCWYCDTRYTSWEPEGRQWSLEEVLREVDRHSCRHAVLTGGEPMLQREIVPLSRELTDRGYHVTIETAATVYRPVQCHLMSLGPKLSNSSPVPTRDLLAPVATHRERRRAGKPVVVAADRRVGASGDAHSVNPFATTAHWLRRHEQQRVNPPVLRRLLSEYEHQVKFVVDEPADVEEIEWFLADYPEIERDRVLLMPQAATAEELAMKRQWLVPCCAERKFRYGPRLHIERFGNTRGT